jgi:SCY1-like protein 1
VRRHTDDRIKYVDSIETDTHVYIATERVRPLQGVLRDTDLKGKAKEEWIGWGVKSVSVSTVSPRPRNCVLYYSDSRRIPKLAITASRVHQSQFDIHHPIYGMALRRPGPLDDQR